jgi:hypothetical protein
MKHTWLVSIIVLALVIIGVVAYLARPRADETSNPPVRVAPTPAQPAAEPSNAPPALTTCVGPMDSQASIASLVAKHKWADALLLKDHVDAAVTELRNIATLDPGYPAINFDISDALLKSKRANEAKEAIKLQIEISGCLAKLPQSDVQAYCKSEWVSAPQGGCEQELAKISQKANYEAGLIDAGLNRPVEPHVAASLPPHPAAVSPPHPIVLPATGGGAVVQPSAAASVPAPLVPKPIPPPLIKTIEAADHVGQQATVCGTVVSKNTAENSNGKPTFVNLDRSFPDQTFTIVIWGADVDAVGVFPDAGHVCVTGTIAMYRGNPQIVIHDSKSWSR